MQTYDQVIELLAILVCTIFIRLCVVLGDVRSRSQISFRQYLHARRLDSRQISGSHKVVASVTQSRQANNEKVEKISSSLRAKLGIPKHEGALFMLKITTLWGVWEV